MRRKIFLVNVNDCISFSHYEPFFYESLYRERLCILDEIKDTCELDNTYKQILECVNQNPFSFDEGVVFVFIPRNFEKPLVAQDQDVYNFANVYMKLVRKLGDDFRCCIFYVDKTNMLEHNDAAYRQIASLSDRMSITEPCGEYANYFPVIPVFATATEVTSEETEDYDFKAYINKKTETLVPCMKDFYRFVLNQQSDLGEKTVTGFKNGVNDYIGDLKAAVNDMMCFREQVYRNAIADDIKAKIKVVEYIKMLTFQNATEDPFITYNEFVFNNADYNTEKSLLATYRKRLSDWLSESDNFEIRTEEKCPKYVFKTVSNVDRFNAEIDKVIDAISITSGTDTNVADEIFGQLSFVISNAWRMLSDFAKETSKALYDEDSYTSYEQESFKLDETASQEEVDEIQKLEEMNHHSVHNLPDFSDENRLEQELNIINGQIKDVNGRLSVYRLKSFFMSLLFSLISVLGLYAGTQYSVFNKEDSWWVFGLYGAVAALSFTLSYIFVKRRYNKELLMYKQDCATKVKEYLIEFKNMAEEFQNNINAAGNYAAFKRTSDKKAEERKKYTDTKNKFSWHKMKVMQILNNLEFFDNFILEDIAGRPQNEERVPFDNFDHDPVHTEFYHLKIFNS